MSRMSVNLKIMCVYCMKLYNRPIEEWRKLQFVMYPERIINNTMHLGKITFSPPLCGGCKKDFDEWFRARRERGIKMMAKKKPAAGRRVKGNSKGKKKVSY